MSDLISRNELLEALVYCKELGRKSCEAVVKVIKNQPIVYSVEKVVEQIKEISYCPISGGCSNCDKCEMAVDVSEAIDLIRKGGAE